MADTKKPKDDIEKPETIDAEAIEIVEEPDTTEVSDGPEIELDTPEVEETELVAAPVVTEKTRGSFVPMVLGGVVAAAIGFGTAFFIGSNGGLFSKDDSELIALTATVEAQKSRLATLNSEIDNLKAGLSDHPMQSDLTVLEDRQIASSEQSEKLTGRIDLAERRLTDIENRPIPEVGATVEAVQTYERELVAMRKMFEEELSRIDVAQKQAAQEGKATTEQANNALESATLARIQAALDSGVPFVDAVSVLVATGITVPDTLVAVAETGVPTLIQLQAEFPEAARAALKTTTSVEPDADKISRIGAYFKAQLGARSLEPREGDDTDAVLSRAEAALRSGDVTATISELNTLPEPAIAQMTAWIENAQIRLTSVTSVSALSAALNE
ncbi:MAG: COG4223 family protein [Paracoccaceae bacterium]